MSRHVVELSVDEMAIINWLASRGGLSMVSDHIAMKWQEFKKQEEKAFASAYGRLDLNLESNHAAQARFALSHVGNLDVTMRPDYSIRACAGVKWLLREISVNCLLKHDFGTLLRLIDQNLTSQALFRQMGWHLRCTLNDALLGKGFGMHFYGSSCPVDGDEKEIPKEAVWELVEELLYTGVAGVTEWLSDSLIRTVYLLSYQAVCRGYVVDAKADDDRVIDRVLELRYARGD